MTRQRWQVERAKTRPRYDPALVADWRWSERRDRLDPAPIHALTSQRAIVTMCLRDVPFFAPRLGYGVVTCTQCQEARRR